MSYIWLLLCVRCCEGSSNHKGDFRCEIVIIFSISYQNSSSFWYPPQ